MTAKKQQRRERLEHDLQPLDALLGAEDRERAGDPEGGNRPEAHGPIVAGLARRRAFRATRRADGVRALSGRRGLPAAAAAVSGLQTPFAVSHPKMHVWVVVVAQRRCRRTCRPASACCPRTTGPPRSRAGGLSFAPSTQVIAPVVHEVTPTLQTPGLVLHAVPAVQAPQTPELLQTMFVPQLLPASCCCRVDAGRRARRAGRRAVLARARVARAGAAGRARAADPGAVADHVRAAAGARALVAAVDARHRARRAGRRAVLAGGRVRRAAACRRCRHRKRPSRCRPCSCRSWCRPPCCRRRRTSSRPSCRTSCRSCKRARVRRAAVAGGARAARARAVADHVRAAAGAGRLVAAVDARHRARRARRRAVLAAASGWSCTALPAVHATQTPEPLQTMFVPQLVPAALLVPSMQVITPVAQDVVPFLQTVGLVVHAVPAVHAPHVPLLQTRFVPHVVPFATFPVSAQTGTPVTHEVAPVLQWFVGWQAAPAVHAPHVPLLQTMFVPHDAPLARFRPVSEHVIVGAQVCVPAWHGFAGVQASPAVHDAQAPELHTRFVPQDVPLATFPDSVQTGAPVLHTVVPVRQGLPVTAQLAPTVQSRRCRWRCRPCWFRRRFPPRDWCSCPCRPAIPSRRRACPMTGIRRRAGRALLTGHALSGLADQPGPARRFRSACRRSPCKRARPSRRRSRRSGTRSSCVQTPPAAQAAHAPLLHTMFVPQAMPFACAVPVSMHDARRSPGRSSVRRGTGWRACRRRPRTRWPRRPVPPRARDRTAGARERTARRCPRSIRRCRCRPCRPTPTGCPRCRPAAGRPPSPCRRPAIPARREGRSARPAHPNRTDTITTRLNIMLSVG